MKCLNAFNEFYFNQFTRLVNECRERNNTNLLNNYRRVCASIQKYPFPILSTQQALTMDGIGEATSRTFEKFIKLYKKKINEEAIDHINLAYEIKNDAQKNNKNKKGKKLKAESQSGSEAHFNNLNSNKNFIKKKPLKNLESFAANWTAALSLYLVYLQDKSLKIALEDAEQMAQAVLEELSGSGIKVQKCALKHMKELKELGMVDVVEEKGNNKCVFVRINEFLIKWAKLEIKKQNIEIDVDDEGTLSFQIKVENKNGNNYNDGDNDDLNSDFKNINNNNFNFNNYESKNKSTDLNLLFSNKNNKNLINSNNINNVNINKNFESQTSVNTLSNLNNYPNNNIIKSTLKNSNLDNFVNKSKANGLATNAKANNVIYTTSNLKENITSSDDNNTQQQKDFHQNKSPIKSNFNNINVKKNYKDEKEEIPINTLNKNENNNNLKKYQINFNNKDNNNKNSNGNDLLANLNYIYENCNLDYNDFDFGTENSGYEAAYSQNIASKPKGFNNTENQNSKYSHIFNNYSVNNSNNKNVNFNSNNYNNNNLNCIYEDSETKNNITHSNFEAENFYSENKILENFDERFKNNYEHLSKLIESSKKNSSFVDLSTLKKKKKNKRENEERVFSNENSKCNSAVKAEKTFENYNCITHNYENNCEANYNEFNFTSASQTKQVEPNKPLTKEEKINNFINNYRVDSNNYNYFNNQNQNNYNNNNINLNNENKQASKQLNNNDNINNINSQNDPKTKKPTYSQIPNPNKTSKIVIPLQTPATNKLQTITTTQNQSKMMPTLTQNNAAENIETLENLENCSNESFRSYRNFQKSLKNSSNELSENNLNQNNKSKSTKNNPSKTNKIKNSKNNPNISLNNNNIYEDEDFETFALNIKLLIDNRERGPKGEKLPDEIRCINPEIPCEERVLAVGDLMWIYCDPHTETEYCLDFIIERKTLADLAGSIKDGRYVEQKHRLKNTKISNVFYLFEGNSFNSAYNSVPKSAVFTAIFNTLNVHDIGVIKTATFEESLKHIDRMDRFIKHFYFVKREKLDLFEMDTFQDFMNKNAKTKNLSEENVFLKQLRCFDDCGAKSVEILKKAFKSPIQFYRLVQKIEDDEEKKGNLIDCMIYLAENNMDLSDENVLYQLEPQNFRKIKKELKSIKKIRKNTNNSIITFYS